MPHSDVRQRIEAAVLKIFSREDFHDASMRDVAREASVSFETIYKYYSSKEKLLFTVVDNHLQEVVADTLLKIRPIEDIKEKLRVIFLTHVEYFEKNVDFAMILFTTIPLKTWFKDKTFKQDQVMNVIMDILRSGQEKGYLNPHVKTQVLLDFMIAMVYHTCSIWMYRGKKGRLVEPADTIFEMVWRAISNPENNSGLHT